MTKAKLTLLFLLFFTVFTFVSCNNEPIDSAIDLNPVNQDCTQPTNFQASEFIEGANINLSWVAGEDESQWQIQYGTQGFVLGSGTIVTATNTNFTVSGLNPSNNYQFYLRSVCDATNNSTWIGPILVEATVQNPNCLNPSLLSASRVSGDNTKINVNWTAGGTETSWEVQYGNAGFGIGSGTVLQSTLTTKQISGLQANQSYDFYVRAKCSATTNSNWVGPFNVAAVVPGSGGGSTPLYMGATVAGLTLSGMKPYFYPFSGIKAKIDIFSDPALGKVLLIQGNSNPLSTTLDNFVEITLRLHQDYWVPGTYSLQATGATLPANTVNLIIVNGSNTIEINEDELPGTITITEFNPTTKRIKGTFSFPYNLIDNGNTTGPFNLTNGTFDFDVEDDVFN